MPPPQHYSIRELHQCCDTAALGYSYYSTVAHPLQIIVRAATTTVQHHSTIVQPYSNITTTKVVEMEDATSTVPEFYNSGLLTSTSIRQFECYSTC
eukprot:4040757-Pyramimonas_sp.AAC.2